MYRKYQVQSNKLRLDRFLAEQIKELSRSRIQKDIEAGLVKINGKAANYPKDIVHFGDQVEYSQPAPAPHIKPKDLAIKPLYENKELLIIDKPAGLVIHPAPGYKGVTLAEGLLNRYGKAIEIGEDQLRPGIIHRLDKDTSGVMLVPKSQDMFKYLKDAFMNRRIRKEYIALVCGRIPSKRGFINSPIGRHPGDFRKMTVVRPKEPKEAITEYNVISYFDVPKLQKKIQNGRIDCYTLVRVKLHTGRTHQIRVHFSSLGFPIAGDKLYGKCAAPELSRQFLHAARIEVQLPDKTWIETESPLPEELQEVLNNFK